VVFAGVMPAAVVVDGSQYYDKSWRHAAGHVVSPPFRHDPLTGEYLLDLLSKSVIVVVVVVHCVKKTRPGCIFVIALPNADQFQ